MAKILLVEDDNNLREIYEARLQAEGYDIVSAKDGEEALVVAKKERPDLIIADVMMPRVSGFEMLDILRNTPELKDVHIIMLTALGQAEDKTRADSLGADRYLVKSQVTLEDIVKAAADVLAGAPAATAAMTAAAADGAQQPATPAPVPTVAATVAIPVAAPPVTTVATATAAPAPQPTPAAQPTAPPAMPSISIPVSAPLVDATSAAPVGQPSPTAPLSIPTQDTQQPSGPAAIPEPSAADSQLVADAVNNLVAGTQDSGSSAPVASQPTPTPAPTMPTQPAAPALTMQPVVTPPPVAATPVVAQPTAPTTPAPSARKAIQPPPPGAIPGPSDLNDLMAKEGHSLDEPNDTPQIFTGSHMPGNVITPGAAGQNPPATGQPPTDPNSISL